MKAHIPAYGMLPLLLKRNLQLEPNRCNMIKLESFLLSRAYHYRFFFLGTHKFNVRINEIHQKTGARVSRCFPKPIASLNDLVVQNPNPKNYSSKGHLYTCTFGKQIILPHLALLFLALTPTPGEGFRNYSALIIPVKLFGEVT